MYLECIIVDTRFQTFVVLPTTDWLRGMGKSSAVGTLSEVTILDISISG